MATAQDGDHNTTPDPPEAVADNPVLRRKVWGKMHLHDDNWMAAVVGETGSGKSWTALRIAEAVDPNFTVDQVAFGIEEFMRLVMDDSLGRGSVIVFEEASVEAAAGEWHTTGNKVLRRVLDTWRHQNRGAIFTLPAFGALDKGARGRMSALIQQQHTVEDRGFSVAKYKWCDQDSDTGKIYKKYPRIGGRKYKRLKISKPSKELREAYEERKEAYTRDLNEQLLEELLEATDDDDGAKSQDPHAIAEEIIENGEIETYVSEHSMNGREYIDSDEIELDYGIGGRKSKKVKKLLERERG
jgi:hypothetical protein